LAARPGSGKICCVQTVGNAPQDRLPVLRRRVLLIGLPFAGGAGLVLHILADVSLPLAIAVLLLLGVSLWGWVMSRTGPFGRRIIGHRVLIGAGAGFIATLAYDAARYGMVALFSFSFKPFHVFSIFGELWVGPHHSATTLFLIGLAYHFSNGTFFGVAYTLVFRRPQWWTGALWGMGLELCMATLYPSWLRVQQLGEFLQVSAIGHVVYGSVLGLLASAALARTSRLPHRESDRTST
jgi:hypothetical protein